MISDLWKKVLINLRSNRNKIAITKIKKLLANNRVTQKKAFDLLSTQNKSIAKIYLDGKLWSYQH